MDAKGEETATDYSRIARRVTVTLAGTQGLVSVAFIASGTISVIVTAQLSGNPAWAGVSTSGQQLGAALAALAVAAMSDRVGRRSGLALGLAVGVLGAALAVGAIIARTLALFLAGAVLLGVASAAMRLGRFAAAEVHPPKSRGQAISHVVFGGAVGSVLGPLLIGPSERWAQGAGISGLAGPYLVTLAILGLATLVIYLGLRPDPRDVSRKIAGDYPDTNGRQGPTRPISSILRTPGVIVAVSAMIVGQVVMAMLTGMASLHMENHHRSLTDISLVATAHTFGMFAFSIVAGRLTDRWGRGPVILGGTAMLAVSSALAPLSHEALPLAAALFLLGVGWNFSYVAGSALLSDQLSPEERAKTQGTNDLLIGLATAGASLGSGLLFAGAGYAGVGVVGAVASLVSVGLAGWWWVARARSLRSNPALAELCRQRASGGEAYADLPATCRV